MTSFGFSTQKVHFLCCVASTGTTKASIDKPNNQFINYHISKVFLIIKTISIIAAKSKSSIYKPNNQLIFIQTNVRVISCALGCCPSCAGWRYCVYYLVNFNWRIDLNRSSFFLKLSPTNTRFFIISLFLLTTMDDQPLVMAGQGSFSTLVWGLVVSGR